MHLYPHPDRRLAKVLNTDRISEDKSFRRFFRDYPILPSYTTGCRTLAERPRITVECMARIAARFSPKLGLSPVRFITLLHEPDANADARVAELLLPVAWPGKRQMVRSFADFIADRMTKASNILYLGHFIPPWIVEPRLRLRTAWCAAGTSDHQKLQADLVIARRLYRELVEGIAAARILVPLFRSESETAQQRQPPFDRFTAAELCELEQDVAGTTQAVPAIIDDRHPEFPQSFRDHFERYHAAILIDDRLLLKQLRRRRAWLAFDRQDGSDVATYIDRERHLLGELRHFILCADRRSEARDLFNRLVR